MAARAIVNLLTVTLAVAGTHASVDGRTLGAIVHRCSVELPRDDFIVKIVATSFRRSAPEPATQSAARGPLPSCIREPWV